MKIKALQDLIPQYPEGAPQTLAELVAYEGPQLDGLAHEEKELVRELKRQVVDAIHAFERNPILCPEDLARHLTERRIPMLARRWMVVCLDARGDRVAVHRSQGGGMRWLQEPYSTLPTPEELQSKLRLPQGGKYLIVYGGGPDVLASQEVLNACVRLVRDVPVTDVAFWRLKSGEGPALFSAKGQAGDQGGAKVEFDTPNAEILFSAFRERA